MSNRNGLGGVDPGGSWGLVYSTTPLLASQIHSPLLTLNLLPLLTPDTASASYPRYTFLFLSNLGTLPFLKKPNNTSLSYFTCTSPFLPYPALILTPQTHSPSYTTYTFPFLPHIHCQLLYPCRSISFSYLRYTPPFLPQRCFPVLFLNTLLLLQGTQQRFPRKYIENSF